jgi:hypothetical protein
MTLKYLYGINIKNVGIPIIFIAVSTDSINHKGEVFSFLLTKGKLNVYISSYEHFESPINKISQYRFINEYLIGYGQSMIHECINIYINDDDKVNLDDIGKIEYKIIDYKVGDAFNIIKPMYVDLRDGILTEIENKTVNKELKILIAINKP